MVSSQENNSSQEAIRSDDDSVISKSPAKQNVAKSLPQTNNVTGNTSQDAAHTDVSMSPNIDNKYVIIIFLKTQLSNPLVLDKFLKEKLLEINMTIFSSDSIAGIKIYFPTKSNKDRFLKAYKDRDFGKEASISHFEQRRNEPHKLNTNTIFTCVIRNIPVPLQMLHMHQ